MHTHTHTHACMHTYIHTDLRKLYFLAGVENKPTVFLFNDTQVVEEAFLEDINNILSSGEVPNLYTPEEFEEVCDVVLAMTLDSPHVPITVWTATLGSFFTFSAVM